MALKLFLSVSARHYLITCIQYEGWLVFKHYKTQLNAQYPCHETQEGKEVRNIREIGWE